MQHAEGGAAERRVGLAQVAGEAEEADGFGGEEMAQRQLGGRLRAAQQVRQALGAVEGAQAVGQVDPVPRLFDGVVGQPALELALEDAAGVVGADLGQGANQDDVLHPGAKLASTAPTSPRSSRSRKRALADSTAASLS